MTILEIVRDPTTGHFDLHLRMTEAEALDLALRITKCAAEATPVLTPTDDTEEPTP